MPQFVNIGSLTPNRVYYLGSAVNLASSGTNTFTNFDISAAPEHANRLIVVVASTPGQSQASGTATIGGSAATQYVAQQAEAMYGRVIPTGSTVNIVISPGGAAGDHCLIRVYAIYPASSTPVDAVSTSITSGAAAATVSDVQVVAGGVMIYGSHSIAAACTHTTTWTGADAVVEDYDTSTESRGETSGHIETNSSTTTDDLTVTRTTTTGAGRIAAVSWGAQ